MKPESKTTTFSELINSETPVLVDFYADWCGPCKLMKPILKEVKKKVGDKAMIIKIDVDRNQQAATKYQIRGVPSMILFKKGTILWQQAGVVQANELERILEQHIH